MKKISVPAVLRLTISLLSLHIIACGSQIPENRKVHRAPTSQAETGVIISNLVEGEMARLLEKNDKLTVRVVNPERNLYELHGAELKEVQALLHDKNVTVEQNRYIELKKMEVPLTAPETKPRHPLVEVLEENLGVDLKGSNAESFISSCELDTIKAPTIQVAHNQRRDRQNAGIYMDLGQTIRLDASGSRVAGPRADQNLDFLWMVVPANYSKLAPVITFNPKVEYTPDSAGIFVYALVAKDALNYCGVHLEAFFATANDAYNPKDAWPDAAADQLDLNVFWHLVHVGARSIWHFASGEGLTLGVIDTGVDYNHPALSSNIFVNHKEIPDNGLDDDGNGFIDDVVGYDFGQDEGSPFDDYGHGTHVAGIAASNIFGAARKAQILPAKVSAGMGFDIASVAGALKYSMDRGVKVINMSIGWEEDFQVIREAINESENRGVLVVTAAGNESTNNDTKPSYPCNYTNKNLLSIAATDENDSLAFYSNFGQTVHIGAPGGTPTKPIVSSYTKNAQGRLLTGLVGTSMASPLVAGVATQIWSVNPDLTADQVRQILLDSGSPSEKLDGQIQSGKVINAPAALERALATRPESSRLL